MMVWHVHYNSGMASGVGTATTLPHAVEGACALLDQGVGVIKIANSRGHMGMNGTDIRLVYAERKAARALH